MKRTLALAMVGALIWVAPAAAATSKFTFDGVTFSDGTAGVIEAGVKVVRKGTVTVCDYYTEGHVTYLGQFQSNEFASSDPDTVKQFCLDNYVNRS